MKKRFDLGKNTNKTTVVDCLECESYYTGACDGNAGGCNAYTPTRKITMSKDISDIKAICKATLTLVFGMALAYTISLIGVIVASL